MNAKQEIGGPDLSLRANLLSPEELAQNLDLSPATLATWRCQHRGPSFLRVGRKIWYPRDQVDAWLENELQEMNNNASAREEQEVALPIHGQRPQLLGEHRLG